MKGIASGQNSTANSLIPNPNQMIVFECSGIGLQKTDLPDPLGCTTVAPLDDSRSSEVFLLPQGNSGLTTFAAFLDLRRRYAGHRVTAAVYRNFHLKHSQILPRSYSQPKRALKVPPDFQRPSRQSGDPCQDLWGRDNLRQKLQ